MQDHECSPFDEVFTHIDDSADGKQTLYNVTQLTAYIAAHEAEVEKLRVPVDDEHAEYIKVQRGIEENRVLRLLAEPDRAKVPIIFIRMPGDEVLLVDGTHRYILYHRLGVPWIPAYFVPFDVGKRFIIEDAPQLPKEVVLGYSFIEEMRDFEAVVKEKTKVLDAVVKAVKVDAS